MNQKTIIHLAITAMFGAVLIYDEIRKKTIEQTQIVFLSC
jgi:hypothetical protein